MSIFVHKPLVCKLSPMLVVQQVSVASETNIVLLFKVLDSLTENSNQSGQISVGSFIG